MLGIFGQAVSAVAKGRIIVKFSDSGIQADTIDDFLGAQTFYLLVTNLLPCSSPLIFRPGPGIEQDQHGQQFQSAGQHVKDQDQFGQVAVCIEVPGGAYSGQAGTDVVQGGGHGGEVGLKIEPVQADGQYG